MDDMNAQFFKNYPDAQTPMERSASAPPVLELSSNNLFAFRTDSPTLFYDARWNESYINFYNQYPQQQYEPQQHPPNYPNYDPSLGFFPYPYENDYQYPPYPNVQPEEEEQVVQRIFNERYTEPAASETHFAPEISSSLDDAQASVWTPPNSLPKKLANLCLDDFSLEEPLVPEMKSEVDHFASGDDLMALPPQVHSRNGVNQRPVVQDHREAFSKLIREEGEKLLPAHPPHPPHPPHPHATKPMAKQPEHKPPQNDPKHLSQKPAAAKAKFAPKKSLIQPNPPEIVKVHPPQASAAPKSHLLQPKIVSKTVSDPGKLQSETLLTNKQKQSPQKHTPQDPNTDDLTAFRYTNFDQVVGQIYSLCKDQHGCRFLQKKLEENNPQVADVIFSEIIDYIVELMTDPFGNYLCQKLLEYCRDNQRLTIIEHVSKEMVSISQNMHGTRAIQKMIEYLNSPDQINLIINALKDSVVLLIQDLNGNHVIQRCLNRLSSKDNQFIYDAVAANCVEVATHRHGCCVLQRCIDHASEAQKIQLVNEITANALELVQDPYGNYVVQYVLDLPKDKYAHFANNVVKRFAGHLTVLSTQKFSSNVIEKCLNVTDPKTRAWMINEFLEVDNLLVMLQDPFANYVIQTSLNVSESEQHTRLVEAIRPHLALLRNTPYGKRIQNKILKEKEMMDRARKKMG